MNVLVTGATGLVGRHVMAELSSRSIRAAGLSRSGSTYAVDLLDRAAMAEVQWGEITHVIHCAAAIPARAAEFSSNVAGTANLLACLPETLQSVVLVSSISADSPSEYGVSKRDSERLCEEWARRSSASLSIFRPTSIFGRGMAPSTIVPVFVAAAKRGDVIELTAPRDYVQNFVWAADVARILVDAAVAGASGRWELSSDDTLDGLELARTIAALFGGKVDDRRRPNAGHLIEFDNSALKRDLSCEFTPFAAALRQAFES